MGPQDPHDTSGFSQAPGYPQQHLTPEQMMLAPGGYALSPLAPVLDSAPLHDKDLDTLDITSQASWMAACQ